MTVFTALFATACCGTPRQTVSIQSRVNCRISVQNITADTVTVAFAGLPGNRPQTYANQVAIWNNSIIPWGFDPMGAMTIPLQTDQGTVALNNLVITATNFVVGYAVGQDLSTSCASARIAPDGSSPSQSHTQVDITRANTDTIVVRYHTLDGYQPASAHNWVGLWAGRVSPYSAPQALGRAAVTSDSTDGTVTLSGLHLQEQTPYTLIYFMGPELTEAGAMLVFQVQARKVSRRARPLGRRATRRRDAPRRAPVLIPQRTPQGAYDDRNSHPSQDSRHASVSNADEHQQRAGRLHRRGLQHHARQQPGGQR